MTALCTLTVNAWDGELPLPGHYVMAERGRTAFLIVEVIRTRAGSKTVCRFRCERAPRASLPVGAVVHPWEWAKR